MFINYQKSIQYEYEVSITRSQTRFYLLLDVGLACHAWKILLQLSIESKTQRGVKGRLRFQASRESHSLHDPDED